MKAITLILISALTLGLSQPVQAQSAPRSQGLSAQHLILGLLGVAIVGNVIHNKSENRKEAELRRQQQAKAINSTRRSKVLPARCLRNFKTRRGGVRMYANSCLERQKINVNRLPARCFVKIRTIENKRRHGFRARCMHKVGYTRR